MIDRFSPEDLARGAEVVEALKRSGYDFTGYEHLLIPDDGRRPGSRTVFDGIEDILYLGTHAAAGCIPAGRVESVSINPIQDYIEQINFAGTHRARIPTQRRTVLVFDCIVEEAHYSGARLVLSHQDAFRVRFKSHGVIFEAMAVALGYEHSHEYGSTRLHVEFDCIGAPSSSAA